MKACLFVSPLEPYLCLLLHWNVRRASKLGAMSKLHCCKIAIHNFNWLYQFAYGLIFIMLGIMRKPVYLSFCWYLICFDCFTATCTGWVNWGQCKKIKCCKIAPIFEIQHDVLFWRISVSQLRMTDRTQNGEITPSYSLIKFCNFLFLTLPPI